MQISTISDALDNLNKKLGGADIEIEPSMNKVDALKKIYKTLGGADDVSGLSTVYQVLEKITEVAEGGGGDFSTAQVTIINTSDYLAGVINVAIASDDDEASVTEWSISPSETSVFTVMLYKGKAIYNVVGENIAGSNVSASGDIEPSFAGYKVGTIFGDGTITISSTT